MKLISKAVRQLMSEFNVPWTRLLPLATLNVNSRLPERNRTAPFEAYFGRAARPAWSQQEQEHANADRIRRLQDVVWPALREAADEYSAVSNERTDGGRLTLAFSPGDLVALRKPPRVAKEIPPFSGPFIILGPHPRSPSGYELLHKDTQRTHPSAAPANRLKLLQHATGDDNAAPQAIIGHRDLPGAPHEHTSCWSSGRTATDPGRRPPHSPPTTPTSPSRSRTRGSPRAGPAVTFLFRSTRSRTSWTT